VGWDTFVQQSNQQRIYDYEHAVNMGQERIEDTLTHTHTHTHTRTRTHIDPYTQALSHHFSGSDSLCSSEVVGGLSAPFLGKDDMAFCVHAITPARQGGKGVVIGMCVYMYICICICICKSIYVRVCVCMYI
jgi:hypothetical protein